MAKVEVVSREEFLRALGGNAPSGRKRGLSRAHEPDTRDSAPQQYRCCATDCGELFTSYTRWATHSAAEGHVRGEMVL